MVTLPLSEAPVTVAPAVEAPVTPALYEVTIGHSRRGRVRNSFRYRSYMWLVNYDDLAGGRPLMPGPLRHLARLDPGDHLDIRAELDRTGLRAARIVTLTNARTLGYVFNPISVHWCYDDAGVLVAHVAEVHNTYGGRHAYVVPASRRRPEEVEVPKSMYVSPFYPVDGSYRMRISPPGPTLSVSVVLERPGAEPFRAGLAGRRRPATVPAVLALAVRRPVAPLWNRALIQWQGIRLWLKGLEVQPR